MLVEMSSSEVARVEAMLADPESCNKLPLAPSGARLRHSMRHKSRAEGIYKNEVALVLLTALHVLSSQARRAPSLRCFPGRWIVVQDFIR